MSIFYRLLLPKRLNTDLANATALLSLIDKAWFALDIDALEVALPENPPGIGMQRS